MKRIVLFYFCFLFFSSNAGTHPNLIKKMHVEKNRLYITPNNLDYFKDVFYIEYDADIDLASLDSSILSIPFIMCVIPIIWMTNKTCSIEAMDEDLYYSLQKIKQVFRLFYPSISWAGELVPQKLVKNNSHFTTTSENELALLFSGGLDAVAASFEYYDQKQLLITLRGFDIGTKIWNHVSEQCKQFANSYGHTTASINFNFHSKLFHKRLRTNSPEISFWHGNGNHQWWDATSHALALTGVAAPLLHLKGQKKLLIASSLPFDFPYPLSTHPLIDNNIAFAGVQVYHVHPDLDRCDKVRVISSKLKEHGLKPPFLRVCGGKAYNCCKCEKCLRTIHNLLIEGENYRDFGFPIVLPSVKARTKAFFKKVKEMTWSIWWEWDVIQKRSLQRKKYYLDDASLKSYFDWLCAIDFDSYCSETKCIEVYKDFFKTITEQAQYGPLSIEAINAMQIEYLNNDNFQIKI